MPWLCDRAILQHAQSQHDPCGPWRSQLFSDCTTSLIHWCRRLPQVSLLYIDAIIGFFCLNGCSSRIHPMRIRLWRGVLMTTTMYYAKAKPALSIYSMVVDLFYNGNCRKKTISLFSWWLFGAFWLVDTGMALSSSLVSQVGRPREKCTSSTTLCDGSLEIAIFTKTAAKRNGCFSQKKTFSYSFPPLKFDIVENVGSRIASSCKFRNNFIAAKTFRFRYEKKKWFAQRSN